ncbi:MAG: hypothetical protein KY455_12850 [Euryarchaeota archaeon]|nr:hypothetical protein [Euryarchaeota archaeon]
MKANKTLRLVRNETAAVGIGTMIVFIATILVAATAAAVLMDTSGKLQDKAQSTGSETTKEVASNLVIKQITGTRQSATSYVHWLNITVSLAPGAAQVDLSEMIIRISNGQNLIDASYINGAAGAAQFNASAVRDDDSSFSGTAPAMNAGDLVNIKLSLLAQSPTMSLQERQELSMLLMPEIGPKVTADVKAPSSYGSDIFIVLR